MLCDPRREGGERELRGLNDDPIVFWLEGADAFRTIAMLGEEGIRITERGRGGNAEHRTPNKFFLTFAHAVGSNKNPPTHDWRRIKTVQEAQAIARAARANKDQRAVKHGVQSWRKRQQKQKPSTKKSHPSVRKNAEAYDSPVRNNHPTNSGEKTVPLSIARVGGSAA